jgi:WD40 repeat protein
VTYSPDEKRIVISSQDGSAKVWDAATGEELLNLCCHLQPVFGAAFSPDGSKVATASADRTVKIWDANTGKELMTLSGPEDQVTNVAFSPDGKQIAGPTWDHTTFIWDSESGNQLYRLAGHTDVVEDASFSPDGKHVVTASDDGSVIIWDAGPSHELSAIAAAPIWRSAISQDGNHLATRHSGSEFMVWDIAQRRPLVTFIDLDAHQVDVQATLAISPDGKRVAYATGNSVRVWDVDSGKQVLNLAPINKDNQPSFVGVPSFSADGKRILGIFDYPQIPTGVERHAVIWDSTSGAQLADFVVAKGDVIGGAIALSPDGTRLVVGDASRAVRVFDARSGESLSEQYNDSFVVHVAISPDGKQYAAASIDGTAVIRDMATGKVLFPPLKQSATIYQLEYSPDGKYISTAGFDGVAKVWDANTGQELHTLQASSAQVRGAHFSANGTHLITTGMDGVIREYTLNIEELVELAKARLTRSLTTEECQQYLHVAACPAK